MKRITFFMMLALSMFSLSSFAQRRELKTEDDGFKWYLNTASDRTRSVEDVNGNVLIPFSRGYDFIVYHSKTKLGGYFTVRIKGKAGACDLKGNEVIPPIYDAVYLLEKEMIGGYYSIKLNNKEGACDINGNIIIEPKYDDVTLIIKDDIVGYFSVELDGKEGVCDIKGREIIAPKKYDEVCYHSRRNAVGYFGVEKKGKEGACDFSGKEVVPCKYKSLIYSTSSDCFSYEDEKNDKWVDLNVRLDKDGLLVK